MPESGSTVDSFVGFVYMSLQSEVVVYFCLNFLQVAEIYSKTGEYLFIWLLADTVNFAWVEVYKCGASLVDGAESRMV